MNTPFLSHARQTLGEYSCALSGAVAYRVRLDRTTDTLRLPAADSIQVNNAQQRAGNGKIIYPTPDSGLT